MQLNPKNTLFFLGIMVVVLFLGQIAGLASKFYFGHTYVFGLVPLFDFDEERNIPTFFSAFLLIFCASNLAIISLGHRRKGKKAPLWVLLSGIFLFLALDEFCSFHERLTGPVTSVLQTSGPFLFAWVIPYSLFLGLLLIVYGRFLFAIPSRIRWMMLLSAFTYVSGAIGLEMVAGWYLDSYGHSKDLTYHLIATCEELLEMTGLIIFVYALMNYIERILKGITLKIAPPQFVR